MNANKWRKYLAHYHEAMSLREYAVIDRLKSQTMSEYFPYFNAHRGIRVDGDPHALNYQEWQAEAKKAYKKLRRAIDILERENMHLKAQLWLREQKEREDDPQVS